MAGSWNSFQASAYHCGVKPAGSQVLNQRVPNEFTTTLPIIASRLMMKNTTSAQTPIAHSRSPMLPLHGAQPLPLLGRAAEQQAARTQQRHDDHHLHQRHQHGDRRGQR